jgi:hypothetical protein
MNFTVFALPGTALLLIALAAALVTSAPFLLRRLAPNGGPATDSGSPDVAPTGAKLTVP